MLNVHSAAVEAYGSIDARIVAPARAEALVFAGVTRRLEAVYADEQSSDAARVAVLHDNRRLWLAAAAAVADDGNAMPDGLRTSLLGLAAFVDRHTRYVMRGEEDPKILFEINRRVVGGLSHGAQ
ncbi:flagellar biosynthesis regulatory protein FlaF [Jannaschia pagri]|uniref:Flagellar biosynthesis regulatory protein FlaF n=1 Tax=Jannaschia pagri TaxID=2829797 RepID=A0ABQ4NM13_9RHOB|nr:MULTISPECIES: flagellar biosynthesis regulator FlaF [unclassified Jannaschia]GIT91616.1 flagellar biosynthesis regulatory protein FlaF [Jannaschia sp. AI_61]GIT95450.1 flagellar biosynthesis regulatory protein FlaF [Jannaschia sp. AI_62]